MKNPLTPAGIEPVTFRFVAQHLNRCATRSPKIQVSLLEIICFLSFLFTCILYDNSLYSSPNIVRVIKSRRMRWAGHVARMSEERGVYRVLVGKPEGRRPLRRPRRKWMDNIRMELKEVGCGYMEWIGLA